MMTYVHRPLAQVLKSTHRKVLILQGARAVGKTMMVQNELSDYHYVTLADGGTYDYASRHLDEWIRSLSTPVIVDEAQRLAGLPLAVKTAVDSKESADPQFVLTGSASITRTGLDGQDPLTRRSQRFTLNPLTRREFNGNSTVSVVDALWTYEPNIQYRSETTRDDLLRFMTTGGFPLYIFGVPPMSVNERRLSLRTDIDNVLGDTILPDEHLDKAIAESALRELLTVPGGILNFKRIADSLGVDPRTVERYVGIFLRRFLIFSLPNLKSTANRQVIARAKIHPVDTSFSVEAFLHAGKDIETDRVLFGQLLESFVAAQIVPETQWSVKHPDAFYWRESGKHPKEVDLVLVHDHELIGIEVKSRDTVERSDCAGLAELKAADSRFRRGFVLYTGKATVRLADDMWALPVSALWDGDGFIVPPESASSLSLASLIPGQSNVGGSVVREATEEHTVDARSSEANLFLSYRHKDDEHLNGAIVTLAHAIVEEYAFQFGGTLGLFVDKESINWGDDWRRVLDQNIAKANIIIPAVTPQYVLSEQCRKELLEFNSRVSESSGNVILPLIWQDIDAVNGVDHKDPVWTIAHGHQWLSVMDLQYLSPSSAEYKQRVAAIVVRLHKVIESQNSKLDHTVVDGLHNASRSPTASSSGESEQPSPLEQVAVLQSLTPKMNQVTGNFSESMQSMLQKMNANPAPDNGSATELLSWGNRLASEVRPDVDGLNQTIDEVTDLWERTYSALQSYVNIIESLPRGSARNAQIQAGGIELGSLVDSFVLPGDIGQSVGTMRMVGGMIRSLKPLSLVFERSVNLWGSMKSMAASLQERLQRLPR